MISLRFECCTCKNIGLDNKGKCKCGHDICTTCVKRELTDKQIAWRTVLIFPFIVCVAIDTVSDWFNMYWINDRVNPIIEWMLDKGGA